MVDPARRALLAALGVLGGCTGVIEDDLAPAPPGEAAVMMPAPSLPMPAPPVPGSPAASVPRTELPPVACAPPPRRIWKLTAPQLTATLKSIVPGAIDIGRELAGTLPPSAHAFTNVASRQEMSQPHVDQLLEVSERVAASALKERAKLLPCLATTLDAMCLRTFVGTFGAKAFRRPLTADEIDGYLAYFDREAAVLGDRVAALGYLLRAFLLSPGFLFRTELGSDPSAGDSELTAWEKASALSYFLTDGPPDATLGSAAMRGALATAGDLEREARRLLTAPGAAKGVLELFEQHLDLGAVSSIAKNAKLFPEWSENLAADLAAETRAFIVEVLWRDDGRLRTLFGAPFSILGERTAKLYGAALVGRNLQRAALPEGQRLGLLGQGSFLASMARDDEGDIVQRGRYVRERLLCQTLPPPPPEVNAVPPRPDGMFSQRDRLARHSSDPSCAGCHKLMDPIGHLFETYDAIGRHRTLELGKPIDTRGEVVGVAGAGLRFDDALALGRVLGDLPEARRCFATRLEAWATGSAEAAACRTDRVMRKLETTDGRVLEAVIDLVTAPDFVIRR